MSARSVSAAVLASVLALAGCGGGDPPFTASGEHDLGDPGGVALTVAPDGRLVTFYGDGTTAGAAVVDPATGEVTTRVELPLTSHVDLAFPLGDTIVLAGPVHGGYDLQVLDPAAGELIEVRHVTPYPIRTEDFATHPLFLPDGRLVVASSSSSEPPVLLIVDPLTGAVTDTVPVTGGPLDSAELQETHGLAVSPDGSRIVLVVNIFEEDTTENDTVALVFDDQFRPVGRPVAMGPGSGSAAAPLGLAVTDDGTVYAAVAGALVTVPPEGERVRTIAELDSHVGALTVTDDSAWLVYVIGFANDDEHAGVHRFALDDGSATASEKLCSYRATPTSLARSPDGSTVYATGTCDDGAVLWTFDAG